ncbi:nucleic acid/nucleotide deaminase domain-containing protein [Streptomyces sp. NPDC046831]|uniref:nucleic acid/nucleotide deaminase domain-containing protein n=1 Tax=Streptomyces sp. NPDC046831 TaxID=3154805 RepID=UPI0033CAC5CD
MSESSPDPSVAHFGVEGMRRFDVPVTYGVGIPDEALDALKSTGVPLHVAPYFTAAASTDGITLGLYAGHHGVSGLAAEQAAWLRLGSDGLAHLCVRQDGAVQAVFLREEEPDMYVSSSVDAFVRSLTVLDRRKAELVAASSMPEAAAVFRELDAELYQIDAVAFEFRESWWPRVVEDLGHTTSFPFMATFEYVDASGDKQVVTDSTGAGRSHPEEIVWRELAARGVLPQQVRRVHCDLEPCMMPGHYCAVWMQRLFPQADFTHSFDYPSKAENREAGLMALMKRTAEQQADDR